MRAMEQKPLTTAELVAAFRELGLSLGDSVVVHSSFRSLGGVDGGPAAVVDALLAAIGPDGNLMLPTFNYTGNIARPHFDPAVTPCLTGVIPELGRQRPGALRSLHPTHSVAVIGPRALELTCGHLDVRAFGIGSPLDRLAGLGGKVLLLGVGHASNSMVHVAEEHAGVPKAPGAGGQPWAQVKLPTGRVVAHQVDTSPSCGAAFGGVEGELRRRGAVRDARIRGAKVQLVEARDVIEAALALMAAKPDVLLCTWPECHRCSGTRENLRTMRAASREDKTEG